VIDLKLHGWPVVLSSYQLQGVCASLMPGSQGIMKVRHYLLFQLWLIKDENATLVEQKSLLQGIVFEFLSN
jgi:hypothetical protein